MEVDQDLNILINYNAVSSSFLCEINYNPSKGLIYVVAENFKEIQVFNLDLTLIRRFSTSSYYQWPITESSNQLYVGA